MRNQCKSFARVLLFYVPCETLNLPVLLYIPQSTCIHSCLFEANYISLYCSPPYPFPSKWTYLNTKSIIHIIITFFFFFYFARICDIRNKPFFVFFLHFKHRTVSSVINISYLTISLRFHCLISWIILSIIDYFRFSFWMTK